MLYQMLNHLKMAIWHLREAKLAALKAKFSYAKGATDILVCALVWLEGVVTAVSGRKVESETVMPDISKGRTSQEASYDYTLRTVCRRPVRERYRRYTFDDDDAVIIKNPRYVSLGKDSDIIWDVCGIEHWIPKTWKQLEIEQLA